MLVSGGSTFAAGAAPSTPVRLNAADTERLGWSPQRLDGVFGYAASLGTDTLMIVTDGETVGAMGDLGRQYHVHSVRKALLSALVGQHVGSGDRQIPLDATLAELGIDDRPNPLTPLQKQAIVLHLVKSVSGINHAAAAEGGLMKEKQLRLGTGENQPGTVWAYNNWDYNALTTVFERRTGMRVADAFLTGIAGPLSMRDFTPDAVSYTKAPELSQHSAAMFRMSGRDLALFGALYLNQGSVNGRRILPKTWIARVSTDPVDTGDAGLRSGHSYLWWIPGPETGLPNGTFAAFGFGRQAVFVIPAWRTVIVHQADTTELIKRLFGPDDDGSTTTSRLVQMILTCRTVAGDASEFCRQHRFIGRREFDRLVTLIVNARR